VATDETGSCPLGKIPQLTFDVVKSGVLDTKTNQIAYNGHVYLLDLRVDSTGVQIAFALQVA